MVKPSPPQWALDAGLPAPKDTETFIEYCHRLGWGQQTIDELLCDLTPRTAPLANTRMAALLIKKLPLAWEDHKLIRYRSARRPSTAP